MSIEQKWNKKKSFSVLVEVFWRRPGWCTQRPFKLSRRWWEQPSLFYVSSSREFHHPEIRRKQGNERHLPSKQGLAINSTRSVSSCFVREQLRRPHKVTEESSSASSRHLSLLKIRKQIIVISGKRHAFRTKKSKKSLLLSKKIRSIINWFN